MRKQIRSFAVTMCLAAFSVTLQAAGPTALDRKANSEVTPVAGQSWLHYLQRSFGDTSMGKTWRLGPPPSDDGQIHAASEVEFLPSSQQQVPVRGADLYRLNCQGCHGEAGLGAPPEINSLIDPVRATSAALARERMKKVGMDITPAAAAELAKQAQGALLQRIHQGGKDMPAFPHLSEAETRSLIAYLNQLAGVPAAAQLTVTESPVRIGEHIVKSTCHTCHDAAGPNPTPQELENGAIPPLATLTTRTDELEFIRKVTTGAPIVMGTPPTPHRGRMPVFYYLTRNEAADVYLYLATYPPSALAVTTTAAVPAQPEGNGNAPTAAGNAPMPDRAVLRASLATPGVSDPAPAESGVQDWMVTIALIAIGSFVTLVILGGLAFVLYEFARLGRRHEYSEAQQAATLRQMEEEIEELVER